MKSKYSYSENTVTKDQGKVKRTSFSLYKDGKEIADGWVNDEREIKRTVDLLNGDGQDRREHRQGLVNKILSLGTRIATWKLLKR